MGIYSVTIADLYFGDGIKNISSTVRMSDKGVDLMNIIILDYGNGRTAAVGTSAIAAMENTAYIMGSEGNAILKSFSGMTEFTIVKGSKATTYTYPNALRGNGFEHELSEAASCILNGKIESEIMPGKKTIYMMELLDKIRGQWGMVYPFEK
jgi:hypothetical protein